MTVRHATAAILIMMAGTLACSTKQPGPQAPIATAAELQVRAARDRFNLAIAKHDSLAIGSLLMPEYQNVSSLNAQTHGATEHLRTWSSVFSQGSTETYVRRTREVRVNERWGQAEELGDWQGTRSQHGEPVRVSGSYAAKWVRDEEGAWRLLSETFTLIGCEGPARGCEPPGARP